MKYILAHILLCAIVLSLASPRRALCDEYEKTLVSLLPASGSIEGWEKDGDYLIYYADELWEYINGAAEGFLAYDVEAVVAQDYLSAAGSGLKIEIYDHQTPLMGFGIYSQHRDPALQFFDVGAEGFGDEYSLHCWKSRYYIKINVFETGEELSRAMMRFAEKVVADIPGEAVFPRELGAFPKEGLIDKSLTYLTEGVLGRGRFPHAFAGEYELEDAAGRLYLFPLGGDGEADALTEWYAGETGAALTGGGTGGERYRYGTGRDPYHGEVAIFAYHSWAGVVTGFEGYPAVRRGIVEGAVHALQNLEMPAPPSGPNLEPIR